MSIVLFDVAGAVGRVFAPETPHGSDKLTERLVSVVGLFDDQELTGGGLVVEPCHGSLTGCCLAVDWLFDSNAHGSSRKTNKNLYSNYFKTKAKS